jgi:zinc protease
VKREPGPLDLRAFAVRLDSRRRVLSNGIVAIAARNRISPALALRGSIRGGALLDTDRTAGLANLAARLFLSGTSRRTATRIAEEIDFVGASLRAWGGRHAIGFGGQSLASDRDTLLDILADVLVDPVYPADEVAREKGRVVTALLEENDDPAAVATNAFYAAVHPDGHPYGRNELGTEETIGRLEREDVAALHRAHVRPDRTILAIAGDVDPDETLDRIESIFGRFSAEGVASPLSVPEARRVPPGRLDRAMPGKSQSEIASGTTGIARAHPDYHALLVGNLVLGQMGMGGRLGRTVREENGLAYSIRSAFEAGLGAGPFLVRAGVNPSNVERALEEIGTVLAATLRDGISEEEVDAGRRYLAASLPRRAETNEGIAAELHEMEFLGIGLDYLERLPALLTEVSRDRALEALRRHVRPAERVTVVAGP